MFPNQIYPILQKHLRDDRLRLRSIYIEGASGIGKSEMVHQLARDEDAELRDKRFSQMDAVDLSGTPWKEPNGYTRWAPPDWMHFKPGSRGILLMDEITSASREVFAASYQLFLDRNINGAPVPPGWMIIALGNRVSDRGVINVMPSPLMNRFVKIEAEPHLESWLLWAGKHGVDPRIMAWVQYAPEYLHNFTPEVAQKSEPFCSPRSIVAASAYLDWSDNERVNMITGCLGKAGASSLESYLRLYVNLPSYDEIVRDPLRCRVPDEQALGEKYAVAMMCSSRMDRGNYERLWQYVDRLGATFVTLATRLAVHRDGAIATAKGFRDFTSKHQSVFERA